MEILEKKILKTEIFLKLWVYLKMDYCKHMSMRFDIVIPPQLIRVKVNITRLVFELLIRLFFHPLNRLELKMMNNT